MHVETSFVRNLGDLIHARTLVRVGSGRLKSRTPSMHVGEKSDGAIVPLKRPNKGGQPPAEAVEGRASTKGEQPSGRRSPDSEPDRCVDRNGGCAPDVASALSTTARRSTRGRSPVR